MNLCHLPPLPAEDDDTRAAASLALQLGYRWPAGTTLLRYRFLDGDDSQKERVRSVIEGREFWSNFCGIQWAEDDAWAEVRITFDRGGSWSHMGVMCADLPQDQPTMQLGWITPSTTETEVRRVVLHEFGHALGFAHEQASPNATIPWDTEAVYAWFQATNGWDREMVDAQVLARLDAEYTLASPFDGVSIMAYLIPDELLTDPAWNIGGATTLSDTDKAMAREWYGEPPFAPPEPKPPEPEPRTWTVRLGPIVNGHTL